MQNWILRNGYKEKHERYKHVHNEDRLGERHETYDFHTNQQTKGKNKGIIQSGLTGQWTVGME